MIVENLLSRLSSAYKEVCVVYFKADQVQLTSAQLELYDNVVEKSWNDIADKEQAKEAIYVFSIPHEGWPDSLDLMTFLKEKKTKAYLLCSNNFIERANDIILNSTAPRIFINKIVPFSSLNQDYCINISSSELFEEGYLERAASESAVERLRRKKLRTNIKKIKIELDEKTEELEKTKNYYESEIEHRVLTLKKKNKDLQAELANAKAELGYHKDHSRLVKSSASYKFGNLFVNAARSPKKLIVLPYAVLRFFIIGLVKKMKAKRNAKETNASKKKGVNLSDKKEEKTGLYGLVKRTSDDNTEKLAAYLTDLEPKENWIGVIGSHGLITHFNLSAEVIQLHPNTWLYSFKKRFPSRVIIEAGNMDSGGGSWASCFEGGAYGYPSHLIEMLSFCRENSIEIILWHTSKLGAGSLAFEFIPFFDKIYMSNKDDEKILQERYGVNAQKFSFLPRRIDEDDRAESLNNVLNAN